MIRNGSFSVAGTVSELFGLGKQRPQPQPLHPIVIAVAGTGLAIFWWRVYRWLFYREPTVLVLNDEHLHHPFYYHDYECYCSICSEMREYEPTGPAHIVAPPVSTPAISPVSIPAISLQGYESKREAYCIICEDNIVEIANTPCGHVCNCKSCYLKLSKPRKCPVCRTRISRYQQLYWP